MFSIGNALGQGFKIWARNIVPFTLLGLILYSPLFLWVMISFKPGMSLENATKMMIVLAVAPILINIFISGVVTYGVVQEMRGQHASIGSSIAVGLRRFLPALGVSLLSMLAMLGGFIACIVPGVIVACTLYVAVQASVIEKPGVMGALKRSASLTSGNRLNIFGLFVIMWLLNFVPNKIVEKSFMPNPATVTFDALRNLVYTSLAISVVLGTIGAVVAATTYFQLRQDKDGVSIDEIARVFD